MFDNDLFNQFSEAFNNMLSDLDKGLRDGVHSVNDLTKSANKKFFGDRNKTNYRTPFRNFGKNISVPNIDNPLNKLKRMRADMVRKDGVLTIHAELPGYEKSKIHVDYRDGEILIRAERSLDDVEDRDHFEFNDRYYGKVERKFKVGKIEVDTVRAAFNNGVLTVSCRYEEDSAGINIE